MTATDAQLATDAPLGYAGASTQRVAADNAIDYAYRDTGDSAVRALQNLSRCSGTSAQSISIGCRSQFPSALTVIS